MSMKMELKGYLIFSSLFFRLNWNPGNGVVSVLLKAQVIDIFVLNMQNKSFL